MAMKKLKEVLDWDRFEEPRRTQIYRLLNAADCIAACERSEAEHSYSAFFVDIDSETPEYTQEIRDYLGKKFGVELT